MLTLNLISQQLKQQIKLRRTYSMIKKLSCFFLILIVIYSFTLLFAEYLMQQKFNEIVNQTTQITKNSQSYNNKVKKINSQLIFIDKIQENLLKFSCLLDKVNKANGNKVTFQVISVSKETGKLIIKGNALTRDDLILFKKNLESLNLIAEVNLPLNNLLSKENVDFEIEAKLVKEKLVNIPSY